MNRALIWVERVWPHACVWALGVSVVLLLSGCQRADAPPVPGQALRDTSRAQEATLSRETDLPIVVDPQTGCQYIGYTGHGLTPRVVWDEKRQELSHMGCRIKEIEK